MTTESSQKTPKKYGTWPSTISSDLVANGSVRFGEPAILGNALYWPQSLPGENGRMTLMKASVAPDGNLSKPQPMLPAPWDIRSKVHEYGGGAYAINDECLFFVNCADQQIYKIGLITSSKPVAITTDKTSRYANLTLHPSGKWLFCVRETTTNSQDHPTASIVAITVHNADTHSSHDNRLIEIATGEDFYSGLCISPNGMFIAFISWNHPDMPWDKTLLWQAYFNDGEIQLEQIQVSDEASDKSESILQPKYSPENRLCYVSDRSNWWNIYRYDKNTSDEPLFQELEECATPQWTFGMSNWGFLDPHTILLATTRNGCWYLSTFNTKNRKRVFYAADYSVFSHLYIKQGRAGLLCAGPNKTTTPAIFNFSNNTLNVCNLPNSISLPNGEISQPRSHFFTTSFNEKSHLWYYPPTNLHFTGLKDSQPPLIVIGHGGPTGMTDTAFNLKIQFWTSRGFAVADVNYRGSTGYGRQYRQRLALLWGVLDVDDLCYAAKYCVSNKLADSNAKIIKGSSAGGYSVLAALTSHSVFDAGVSLYGIADLELLLKDTHKFEAYYLDSLIGKYPEQQHIYSERSPINHIKNINCPILIAQGLDDKVVPPSQAELIVSTANANGSTVEYLPFAGEGHGFRKAHTIKTLFEKEYEFYCNTFDLTE